MKHVIINPYASKLGINLNSNILHLTWEGESRFQRHLGVEVTNLQDIEYRDAYNASCDAQMGDFKASWAIEAPPKEDELVLVVTASSESNTGVNVKGDPTHSIVCPVGIHASWQHLHIHCFVFRMLPNTSVTIEIEPDYYQRGAYIESLVNYSWDGKVLLQREGTRELEWKSEFVTHNPQ